MRVEGQAMAGGPRTGDVKVGKIRFELRERKVRPSPTQIRDPHLRENPGPVEPAQKKRRSRPYSYSYDRRAAQPTTTPPETIEEIVQTYRSGLTVRETGEKVGVSYTTALRYVREAGVQRRGAEREIDVEEAARMYEGGASIRDVAGAFGVSTATIRRRLTAAGVEMRSQGAWRAMRREASAVGARGEDQS